MNKRICDLSDIESLYFFQNSKETEMQENQKIQKVYDTMWMDVYARLKELRENSESGIPATGQCFLSSNDLKNSDGYIIGHEFTKNFIAMLNDLAKPQRDESKDQSHKVHSKPQDDWKDYCRGRYIRSEPNNTQNSKLEKCDECARSAKKFCNCGYFQAIPIYKPQNLEASTTSKLENSYYQILAECAKEFKFKNELYGDSVFQVRESSLVDKLYAKAKRVITLSKDGVSNKGRVGESIAEDLKAIINYTLIILVLLQKTEGDKCLEYNNMVQKCIEVAEMKDADYGSAWKEYRVETLLDEVFVKVYRLQSLIASKPKGYEDNYFDLINYAIFSLIKLR